MQVITDPGKPSGNGKGATVQEVRVELDSYGDGTHGVVLHLNEYRGALLVTVTHGDPEWRTEREARPALGRRRPVPRQPAMLVVDGYPYPDAPPAAPAL
jgi:hypothetical protein